VSKRYPDGPKVRVDDEWRRAVQAILDDRNISHAQLATLVQSTRPAISQLLTVGRGPKTSSLALPVAQITGVAVPGYEDDAEIALFARFAKRLRNRDPHRFRVYEDALRRLVEQLELMDKETLNTISALDVNMGREPQDEIGRRRTHKGGKGARKR
jgi:hypothetical protein